MSGAFSFYYECDPTDYVGHAFEPFMNFRELYTNCSALLQIFFFSLYIGRWCYDLGAKIKCILSFC